MADEDWKVYIPKKLEERVIKFTETEEGKALPSQKPQDAVRHMMAVFLEARNI